MTVPVERLKEGIALDDLPSGEHVGDQRDPRDLVWYRKSLCAHTLSQTA